MMMVIHRLHRSFWRALATASPQESEVVVDWSLLMHDIRRELRDRRADDGWAMPALYANDPTLRIVTPEAPHVEGGRSEPEKPPLPESERLKLTAELDELERFLSTVDSANAPATVSSALTERIVRLKELLELAAPSDA